MTRPLRIGSLAFTLLLVALAVVWASASESSAASHSRTKASNSNVYGGLQGASAQYLSAGSTGSFNSALQGTIISAFNHRTGASVTVETGNCGITQLAGEVNANDVTSDIWQFCTPSDYEQAIAHGLLQKLNTAVVPLNKLRAGTYTKYGFDAFQFAIGLLYNKKALSGAKPTSMLDIFDTKNYRGKRCISNYPQYNGSLEAAMLEAGKRASKVYPLNMKIVFSELGKIRKNIVFYSSAAQGFQDVLNGTCSMMLTANGSAYNIALANRSVSLGFTLNDAVETSSPVAIPKNAPNANLANALLRWYITDTSSQTSFIKKTSYVPAVLRISPKVPAAAKSYALAGSNLQHLVKQNDSYWTAQINTVLKEWNAWLAK